MVHGGGRDVFLGLPVRNQPGPGAEMLVLSLRQKGPDVSTLCVRGSAYLRYCIQFMAGHVPLCIPHVKKKGSSLLMHCITFKKVQVL